MVLPSARTYFLTCTLRPRGRRTTKPSLNRSTASDAQRNKYATTVGRNTQAFKSTKPERFHQLNRRVPSLLPAIIGQRSFQPPCAFRRIRSATTVWHNESIHEPTCIW